MKMLAKNENFGQKMKNFLKDENCSQKFWSKIKILVRNRNLNVAQKTN